MSHYHIAIVQIKICSERLTITCLLRFYYFSEEYLKIVYEAEFKAGSSITDLWQ